MGYESSGRAPFSGLPDMELDLEKRGGGFFSDEQYSPKAPRKDEQNIFSGFAPGP